MVTNHSDEIAECVYFWQPDSHGDHPILCSIYYPQIDSWALEGP